jgi:hypothetical protein
MKSFKDLSVVIHEKVDVATVRELLLYITNDAQINRQRIQPIIKNLSKKVGKGTYDGILAIKAFGSVVTDGIKKYEKENATKGWARGIDKSTKQALAKELADYYMDEIGESVNVEDGEELEEMNYMVDIEGIGKVIVDGKSSSEVKIKVMKKLRKPDDIKGIERMSDPEKKKYFRTKAIGKDEGE